MQRKRLPCKDKNGNAGIRFYVDGGNRLYNFPISLLSISAKRDDLPAIQLNGLLLFSILETARVNYRKSERHRVLTFQTFTRIV